MPTILLIMLSAVLFLCVTVLVDALVGIIRRTRGVDEDAIERRLYTASPPPVSQQAVEILLSDVTGSRRFHELIPFFGSFKRLVLQSGTKATFPQLACLIGAIWLAVGAITMFLAPFYLAVLLLPVGLACAIAAIAGYLAGQRSKRVALFEEQLPDAIELMVRSLKVGHPVSSALGVIGREMPPPIAAEFAIAAEKASYGKSIPLALEEMQARVPVRDLDYLIVAVQTQQESGGNLVESLGKLSLVIRDRFRMFRKARAITSEGRISAWLLSFFPFLIVGGVLLAKPDYYSQVMNYPHFTGLLVLTLVMLAVNILAMRILTNLKI
jgi:tight adherence protein B